MKDGPVPSLQTTSSVSRLSERNAAPHRLAPYAPRLPPRSLHATHLRRTTPPRTDHPAARRHPLSGYPTRDRPAPTRPPAPPHQTTSSCTKLHPNGFPGTCGLSTSAPDNSAPSPPPFRQAHPAGRSHRPSCRRAACRPAGSRDDRTGTAPRGRSPDADT